MGNDKLENQLDDMEADNANRHIVNHNYKKG